MTFIFSSIQARSNSRFPSSSRSAAMGCTPDRKPSPVTCHILVPSVSNAVSDVPVKATISSSGSESRFVSIGVVVITPSASIAQPDCVG